MSKLEEFIIDIIRKGIPITGVELVGDSLGYIVPGFSKSGSVILYCDYETITAKQRYGEEELIYCFDDLVSLAYVWYLNYRDRQPFSNPDPIWLPHFIASNRIKVKEEVIKTYIPK